MIVKWGIQLICNPIFVIILFGNQLLGRFQKFVEEEMNPTIGNPKIEIKINREFEIFSVNSVLL